MIDGAMKIVGYYTNNQCVSGTPEVVTDEALGYFVENKIGEIQIIMSPLQPQEIKALTGETEELALGSKIIINQSNYNPYIDIDSDAARYLVKSGNYKVDNQGIIRSTYLINDVGLIAGNLDAIKIGVIRPKKIYELPYLGEIFPSSQKKYRQMASCANFFRLENRVRLERAGRPPIYVIDSHQYAYFAWHEAQELGYINKGATLIHLDAHRDDRAPFPAIKPSNLKEVAQALRRLDCGNFILPAVWDGTVNEYWNFFLSPYSLCMFDLKFDGNLYWTAEELIEKKQEIQKYFSYSRSDAILSNQTILSVLGHSNEPKDYILDIDIDAFVKVGYCDKADLPVAADFQKEFQFLSKLACNVGVVTIATSPNWAHEVGVDLARELAREILESDCSNEGPTLTMPEVVVSAKRFGDQK